MTLDHSGVPADVLLARLEAYLGRFNTLFVPEALAFEPFWGQKRVGTGPNMHSSVSVSVSGPGPRLPIPNPCTHPR